MHPSDRIITPPPVPGEERAELIAAIDTLKCHAQAFNSRGITAATIRALECFDQMRERLREAQMPGYIREELQARLAWVEERPQILAINIDVAVIKRLVGDPS
jgi:tagatose-1,6-bisphosphate aldolase non-catalytic subunit AgaZ/GatZ